MKFTMIHYNINVTDLEKSLAFYAEALGLTEARRIMKDRTTWGTKNSTLLSVPMILKLHMPSMKPWAASTMKIRIWESTLLPIRTATGWKLCRPA